MCVRRRTFPGTALGCAPDFPRDAPVTDPPAPVDQRLADLVAETADAVIAALGEWDDWGPSGGKVGQYASDLAADTAVHDVLDPAGVGVLSEESGFVRSSADVVVIVDPLDGSTNASRGLSWWATSICAVDAAGPAAAVVHDLRHGTRYSAVRGQGAFRDGVALRPVPSATSPPGVDRRSDGVAGDGSSPLDTGGGTGPSGVRDVADAMVGISGLPPRSLGWRQFRALGAVALDLCAVADGRLDAFVDCSPDAHGVWDYAGALLVCREAGASVVDALGRDLVVLDHGARRTPVAAATPELCAAFVAARAEAFGRPGPA